MCVRCDAWEYVIDNWFGETLLSMLEVYVAQRVERMKPQPGDRYATENRWLVQTPAIERLPILSPVGTEENRAQKTGIPNLRRFKGALKTVC